MAAEAQPEALRKATAEARAAKESTAIAAGRVSEAEEPILTEAAAQPEALRKAVAVAKVVQESTATVANQEPEVVGSTTTAMKGMCNCSCHHRP